MDITELDLSTFLESEEQIELSKKLIAECEAFMASCGKADLEVYRIEKFKPTLQPEASYGKFYSGDSYVVIKKNEREYEIHYWHGKEATTDEIGSSAAFTTQLSGVLPRSSNHHLEEQLHESEMFLSYFKNGVEYLEGGVETGFSMVEKKEFKPRLLAIKGERYARVFPVEMTADSINEGDVFILDMNEKLYFWPGDQCKVNEKMKGLEVATNIRKAERHAQAEVIFPKEDDEVDKEFWGYLGGKPAKINPATSDAEEEMQDNMNYSFYKISNETGKLQCIEITERPLDKNKHLSTNDTFVLETPKLIYCWIGKEANVEEKKNALIIGKSFLKQKNHPKGTRVTRIVERAEDVYFKSFFENFYPILKVEHGGLDAGVTAQQDMDKLANERKAISDKLLSKLGNLKSVDVYLCKDDKLTPIPAEEHGHFFQDDVYLIDLKGDQHRYLIQWFGPRLPGDEVSAHRSYMDILTEGVFSPKEITRTSVMQGHEDQSLLQFFPKGFVCHDGARIPLATKLDNIKASGAMYRVQGPFGEKPQAIQQDILKCENLNSNESFVVIPAGGDICFCWNGEGASDDEKKEVEAYGGILLPGGSLSTFKEGEEPEEFWTALGGKTEYSSIKALGIVAGFNARLFQCSTAQGYFHMKECYNFSQHDLNNHDVMVLDAFSTLYLWIGLKSNKTEQKNCLKKVQKYVESISDGRDKSKINYVQVDPGSEPFQFRGFFPEWEDEVSQKWFELDPYEAAVAKAKADKEKAMQAKYGQAEPTDADYLDPATNKFDLAALQAGCPPGVNPRNKPGYLSNEDFESAFKMTQEAYAALKEWKQRDLKKACGLF